MANTTWPEVQARASQPGSRVLTKFKAEQEAKRAQARPAQRGFNAARIDRLTASWLATTASINQELRGDLDRLRARARDLVQNNEYARKFKKLVVTNVVGPSGFTLQARVSDGPNKPDRLANAAIEAAFLAWCKRGVCEISGRMGFTDVCRTLLGGMASDGEYLVRTITGGAAGNDFGFALQLIDIDRLDTNYNIAPASGRNAIIMGVEVDGYQRPVAYHIFSRHPSDSGSNQRTRERIPASEILHDFIVERADQVRGVPWMSAVILTMHHLGEFEASALLAARKGADTLGFFVSPNGEPPAIGDTAGTDDEPISISVPGHYDTLPEGYDFRPYDSRYPDAMLADFTKGFLRRMSSGLNVAYNGLANDLEGVNFSSIRSGVIDERDQWLTIQGWFIESFLIPVFNAWLGAALLNGAIVMPNGSALPAAKRDKFSVHTWQGRRWQWVDPVKDIEAARLAIKTGIASPQMIAAQAGVDVEDVLDAIATFESLLKEKSLTLIDYGSGNAAPTPPAATASSPLP